MPGSDRVGNDSRARVPLPLGGRRGVVLTLLLSGRSDWMIYGDLLIYWSINHLSIVCFNSLRLRSLPGILLSSGPGARARWTGAGARWAGAGARWTRAGARARWARARWAGAGAGARWAWGPGSTSCSCFFRVREGPRCSLQISKGAQKARSPTEGEGHTAQTFLGMRPVTQFLLPRAT